MARQSRYFQESHIFRVVFFILTITIIDEAKGPLSLSGEIATNGATAATLTITHRGGDKIIWEGYKVTCNGTSVTSATTETSVGEVGTFAMVTTAATALLIDEEYTARIIELETNKIVWEDNITTR